MPSPPSPPPPPPPSLPPSPPPSFAIGAAGSDFGGVLDMVTDRTSTACLLLVCAHLYAPAHGGLALLFFGSLIMLDVFSHWLHMLAAAKAPAGKHHKDTGDSSFFLVRFYYGCYPFFGYCCVGTEVFYVLLYVRSFVPDATVLLDVGGFAFTLWHFCFAVCAPACTVKQICNFSQLYSGAISLAALDVEARAAKKKK